MYVSRPVRRMRDDPIAGERVSLLLEFADGDTADVDAVAGIAEEYGGDLETDLQFADVAVTLPEAGVAAVCALDGVERIETRDTLDHTPSGAEE
ncbi:MAG: hypothetical protein ABEJ74_04895 [Haloferacaceae archaeon]